MTNKLIFDYSKEKKSAYTFPKEEFENISLNDILNKNLLRTTKPRLPEVSEIELIRHYTALSKLNYGVDDGFYPLGSCTMKYNPKINEDIANMESFTDLHPLQDEEDIQGILFLLHELEQYLCSIFGFSAFTLQPAAGAHGEYTALLIIQAYHKAKNNHNKHVILIPDSAHGTNPASVTGIGWKTVSVKSNNGCVDLEDLKKKCTNDVAGMMLTNPNTLGIFEKDIMEISNIIHSVDGLMYWDGANANATMGLITPPQMGFDICHINLHKTFSTPHGGGGPGAGPVGVIEKLVKFLPSPKIINNNGTYSFENPPNSIGQIHSFYGNVNVLIKAYCYIRMLGSKGLREVSENAVLLANYMKEKLKPHYEIFNQGWCKHEFVISLKQEKKEHGIRALDVAKRLIDYGIHPPTIYFPLIVPEALMIEPTETEPIESIDNFINTMIAIKQEILHNPELLLHAPQKATVGRLNEVKAIKEPVLSYFAKDKSHVTEQNKKK
jgi:glycine dehydrogenase subunit 2